MDLSAHQLDWSQAQWFFPQSSMQAKKEQSVRLLFASDFKKEYTFGNFTIRVNYTTSSFRLYVFTETSLGANFFLDLSFDQIQPDFGYQGTLHQIDRAWLKVKVDSNVATGLKKGSYQQLYLNPAKNDSKDWLKMLQTAWTTQRATVDTLIPLGELRIPISGFPQVQIILQIQLRLYLNGTVELLYALENEFGFEIKNNQCRLIHENSQDLDFLIQATSGITSKLLVGAELFQQRLLDAALEAGIRAQVKSTLHLTESQETIEEEQIPYDVLETLNDQEGLLLCADLRAHWLLGIQLNSSRSWAGRLGLGKEITLLDERNGTLFQGAFRHIENMQFVDHCTRTGSVRPVPTILVTMDRIILESYSYLVTCKETIFIKVRGLPKEMKRDDLCFFSENPQIATVDDQGRVTGVRAGITKITISDRSGRYTVQCSVLVRET